LAQESEEHRQTSHIEVYIGSTLGTLSESDPNYDEVLNLLTQEKLNLRRRLQSEAGG